MASSAGVGDFVFVRHGGIDELKRVRPHFDVRNRRLNLRHVTSHALAAGRVRFVVGVFLQTSCTRPVQRHWADRKSVG